jgi:hypothetical protein
MLRYLPYALGVILLAGATLWQAKIVDRWGMSGISEEGLNQRFANVPMNIGDWVGTDHEVEDIITEKAGAVAHVNRVYRNTETGEEVAMWLIAGHAKDIVRHTPDICYPAQGYRRAQNQITHEMPTADGTKAVFWTAVFAPETQLDAGMRRVFWAWAISPEGDAEPEWRAPSSPRQTFRNTPSLFKMYFTSLLTPREETAAASPCTDFARTCIPRVNEALFGDVPANGAAPSSEATTAADAAADGPASADAA